MTADLIAAVAAVGALLGAYWARQAAQRTTKATVKIAEQLPVHTQYLSSLDRLRADQYALDSIGWGQIRRVARNPEAPDRVRADARETLADGLRVARREVARAGEGDGDVDVAAETRDE